MEEARRKIRICLICIVAAAIIIGCIYYFSDVVGGTSVSEGTLVMSETGNRVYSFEHPAMHALSGGSAAMLLNGV